MNEAAIAEYVALCEQKCDSLAEDDDRLDRLDQLWYKAMTDEDHAEAERRLIALDVKGPKNT